MLIFVLLRKILGVNIVLFVVRFKNRTYPLCNSFSITISGLLYYIPEAIFFFAEKNSCRKP